MQVWVCVIPDAVGNQGCLAGGSIPGGTTSRASPLGAEQESSGTFPREFKQVKHHREATAGDLQGQILQEDVFPGLSAGKSCFWEVWCNVTEMLGVFLLRHPLGRLGFSAGALGMLKWKAQELPPSPTPPLASLKSINRRLCLHFWQVLLPAFPLLCLLCQRGLESWRTALASFQQCFSAANIFIHIKFCSLNFLFSFPFQADIPWF